MAVLADVHGNVAALDAVLAEVRRERPDVVVVGGDVVSGPYPCETLERLRALERAQFVRGNADREVVEAFDRGATFDLSDEDPVARAARWSAARLTRGQRDVVAAFADQVVLRVRGLGEVLFCHGSPRSDQEIITSLTPETALRKLLAGVAEPVVVCGHTHVQFDRTLDTIRVINAGSVGMAYEGRRGAFWLMLGPDVRLLRTEYDCERAAAQILASDYWDAENLAREIILNPPDPREVERYFEQVAAERGERS